MCFNFETPAALANGLFKAVICTAPVGISARDGEMLRVRVALLSPRMTLLWHRPTIELKSSVVLLSFKSPRDEPIFVEMPLEIDRLRRLGLFSTRPVADHSPVLLSCLFSLLFNLKAIANDHKSPFKTKYKGIVQTGEMRTETEEDWEDCPLFAPQGASIPQLPEQPGENVSSAVAALSHLLYDEETPLEASELLRDEGNRSFKRGRRFVCEISEQLPTSVLTT